MIDSEYKILFVCMGNICRSPTAEAVLHKRLADQKLLHIVKIDSAGTHNFHPDAPPDERSQAHALKRGYDLSNLRARPVVESDFEEFDLLLTMDWDNRALLESRCPTKHIHKIRGLAEFLQKTQASDTSSFRRVRSSSLRPHARRMHRARRFHSSLPEVQR